MTNTTLEKSKDEHEHSRVKSKLFMWDNHFPIIFDVQIYVKTAYLLNI